MFKIDYLLTGNNSIELDYVLGTQDYHKIFIWK